MLGAKGDKFGGFKMSDYDRRDRAGGWGPESLDLQVHQIWTWTIVGGGWACVFPCARKFRHWLV